MGRISKEEHQRKLGRVVRDFSENASGEDGRISLDKSTETHLYRPRDRKKNLDVKDFINVISIDSENSVALVEGMIPFDFLVHETLKEGLIPQVVPELRKLTVGGVTTGVGIEATSFRYGLFHETVTSMTVLTGNGDLVHATPENENSDLFFGFPNSYATFGYLLNAEVSLMEAKPYVELKYLKYSDLDAYFVEMKKYCASEEIDFIDGAIFSQDLSVLVLGKMVDQAPYTSNYRSKGIYYKAIQEKDTDYLTISDFLWRWDADAFWSTKNTPLQNPMIRRLIGERVLRSDTLYKWSDAWKKLEGLRKGKGHYKEPVTQDVGLGISQCAEFIRWFDKEISMYPIWICPVGSVRASGSYPLFTHSEEIQVDIGYYGGREHTVPNLDPFHYTKLADKKVHEMGGIKALYSRSFYDEETFWKIFDKSAYDGLKKKYDTQGRLKNLYQKTVLNS